MLYDLEKYLHYKTDICKRSGVVMQKYHFTKGSADLRNSEDITKNLLYLQEGRALKSEGYGGKVQGNRFVDLSI